MKLKVLLMLTPVFLLACQGPSTSPQGASSSSPSELPKDTGIWLKSEKALEFRNEGRLVHCGDLIHNAPDAFSIDPESQSLQDLDEEEVIGTLAPDGSIEDTSMTLIKSSSEATLSDTEWREVYIPSDLDEVKAVQQSEEACVAQLEQDYKNKVTPQTAADLENQAVLAKNQVAAATQKTSWLPGWLIGIGGAATVLGLEAYADMQETALAKKYVTGLAHLFTLNAPIIQAKKNMIRAEEFIASTPKGQIPDIRFVHYKIRQQRLKDRYLKEGGAAFNDFNQSRRGTQLTRIGTRLASFAIMGGLVIYGASKIQSAWNKHDLVQKLTEKQLNYVVTLEDSAFRTYIRQNPAYAHALLELVAERN